MRIVHAFVLVLVCVVTVIWTTPLYAESNAADGTHFNCPGRAQAGTATVYFPNPIPPRTKDRERLFLSDNEAISLEGKPFDVAQLPALMKAVGERPNSELTIQVDKMSSFGRVFEVVSKINAMQFCEFNIINNFDWADASLYSNQNDSKSVFLAPAVPSFAKVFDQAIFVDYGSTILSNGKSERNLCRMYIRGKLVSFDEALVRSFENLRSAITWMGGIEMAIARMKEEGSVSTIIQAKATVPWHCVGGALYVAQVSGYPQADLVLLP